MIRLGDIKIESIKLMFTNYNFDFGIDDLQSLVSDENYGSYIVNMNGSIARALDRIENACVVPLKRRTLGVDDVSYTKNFIHFDLGNIDDLFLIDRITAEYDSGDYEGNVDYSLEGDLLILPKDNRKPTYSIVYYPTIKTIDDSIADTDEMWIPDKISRLIPYFVKGDLYQEEEPSLAADARNLFEACLDDIKKNQHSKQNYIHQTYRMY